MTKKIFAAALTLFTLTLAGCSAQEQGFVEGEHEREDAYAAEFSTMDKTTGDLTLHVASSIFDETAGNAMLEQIQSDLDLMDEAGAPAGDPVDVYIVLETLSGNPQAGENKVFCTRDQLESGAYHQYLVQAALDQDTFWKAYGLSRYIFGSEASETPDSQELETYYQDGEHAGTFSLLPVYFSEDFADENTVAIAQATAEALTQYCIAEYGMDQFLESSDMSEYRKAWAESLGLACGEDFPAEADQVQYVTDDGSVMELTYENFTFYMKPTNWLEDADAVYSFLTQWFDDYSNMVENFRENEPEAYELLEENINRGIYVYLENEEADVPSLTAEDGIITLRYADALCHEIGHCWSFSTDSSLSWLTEGMAEFFSIPANVRCFSQLETVYKYVVDEDMDNQLDNAGDRLMMQHIRDYYLSQNKEMTLETREDYAFLYEAIGASLLGDPECETTLTFANTSVLIDGEGVEAVGGNALTYVEAYVLTKYLAETYGLDTIIKVMQGEYAYTDVFPEDFEEILADYREYAGF